MGLLLVLLLIVGFGLGIAVTLSARWLSPENRKNGRELRMIKKQLKTAQMSLMNIGGGNSANSVTEAQIALADIDTIQYDYERK